MEGRPSSWKDIRHKPTKNLLLQFLGPSLKASMEWIINYHSSIFHDHMSNPALEPTRQDICYFHYASWGTQCVESYMGI
jgi:hypothetical protein